MNTTWQPALVGRARIPAPRHVRPVLIEIAALASLLLAACGRPDVGPNGPATLEVTSSSFPGGIIPKEYSCDGREASPELSWESPPAGTRSYALIATDKDSFWGLGSVFGYFVHWLVYDIPAQQRELPAGVAKQKQLADGSRQGTSDFDSVGYGGPCPPGHSPHRYAFVLYALDSQLDLPGGASEKQLLQAMQGHVLAKGEVIGRFQH